MNAFKESSYLRNLWSSINASCFDDKLGPLCHVGWLDLSGAPDLQEEFGYYSPKNSSIAISHSFQYVEDQDAEILRRCSDSRLSNGQREQIFSEFHSLEIVYSLMLHEMVHQAVHQAGDSPVTHGEPFVRLATSAAKGAGTHPPTLGDAAFWPDIRPHLAKEMEAGRYHQP